MKITKQDIEKLSSLSKIEAKESEVEPLREKLDAVLNYASGLAEISKKQISKKITTYVTSGVNVVRKDEIVSCDPEIILKQVPQVSNHFIVVPKIVK